MKALVELARHVYVTNLSQRFGLNDDEGNDTASIRHTVVHGAILNPLTGKHPVLSCFSCTDLFGCNLLYFYLHILN
jgi:hypothetical protein